MPRLDVDATGMVSVVRRPTLTPHQFPRGALPGTFLHNLLEGLDLAQPIDPNWVQEEPELGSSEPQWKLVLTEWITTVLQAPLSETDVSLNQLSDRDKRMGMGFYLPINEPLIANQLDTLIRQFDPLSAGYPPLEFMQIRGVLKGFIDLVFRHEERYYLFDYKSNRLDKDSSAYTQQVMTATVQAHRYDLQYQLYTLTLHRYLRHCIADYDYECHFGGVIYLFLRGVDKEHPQQGVYATRPNAGLIDLMDKIFASITLEKA